MNLISQLASHVDTRATVQRTDDYRHGFPRTGELCVLPWIAPHSIPTLNLVGGFWNAGKQERLFSRHPPGCLLSASSTQHIPWDLFGDLRILQLLFPREVVLSAKHVFVHGSCRFLDCSKRASPDTHFAAVSDVCEDLGCRYPKNRMYAQPSSSRG